MTHTSIIQNKFKILIPCFFCCYCCFPQVRGSGFLFSLKYSILTSLVTTYRNKMPLNLLVCQQAKNNKVGVTRILPVSEENTRKIIFLLQNCCKNKIKIYIFHSFSFLKVKIFLYDTILAFRVNEVKLLLRH